MSNIDLMSAEQLEVFVNDCLREDLKQLEKHLLSVNSEISEYNELQMMLKNVKEHLNDGFKTQVNIGGNFFMQARVDDVQRVLVNVGKGIYVDFTLDEALKFTEFKVKVLEQESTFVREESIKKRADIKLALMCIAEKRNLYTDFKKDYTVDEL